MIVEACPGCNSQTQQTAIGEGESLMIQLQDKCFCQPNYQIRICGNCGLYYKSNILDSAALSEYYKIVDFSKWELEALFPTEETILKTLNRLKIGSKILDYGCSSGRLLSHLTHKYQCFGYEISDAASSIASQRGIYILNDSSFPGIDYFDAIVLCDVFEHLDNPTSTLKQLCSRLNEAGILIICTGNADAWASQKDIANFWYFRNVEHLCMLGRKYADFVASELGLELIGWMKKTHFRLSLFEKIFQFLRFFAYWQFKRQNNLLMKSLLSLIPFIRRAENWEKQPLFWASKDHIIAIYRKRFTELK
jgi:SAM-dependent methyltransferase